MTASVSAAMAFELDHDRISLRWPGLHTGTHAQSVRDDRLSRGFQVELKKLSESRVMECMRGALQELHMDLSTIDQLLVFGGSAAVPSVQEACRKLLGERVRVPKQCQEVVAEGAMIHASLEQEFQCIE